MKKTLAGLRTWSWSFPSRSSAGSAPASTRKHRPSRIRSSPRTARWSSRAATSAKGKTSGRRWAAWRSARFGATAAMSHRTGRRTGCIENASSSSTIGPNSDLPEGLRPDRAGAAGPASEAPGTPDANEHVRSRHADDHGGPGAGQGVRGEPAALHRRVQQRQHDYAIPKGAQSDPDKLRQLAAFFFWTSWAASTNRPGADLSYTSNWPHEPLVSNRPDRRGRGLDRRERHHAARRDRSDGLVVRLAIARTPHGAGPRSRSHHRLAGHAVPASDGQVFLGRGGHDPRANPAGRRHRPLRRRGRRLLRHPALEVAALQRDSDVAPATRRAVDCDGVAGRWPVHWAAGQRIGTEGPAARRQPPVRCPAGGRGRVDGRAVVEHPEPSLADAPPSTSDTRATSTSTWAESGRSASSSACCSGWRWSCEWSFRP